MGASIYAQIYNRKWQKGCKYVKNESEIMKPVEMGKRSCFVLCFFFSKPWKFCKMKIQILCSVSSRGYSSLSTVFSMYQTQRWMGKKALTFSNTTLGVCRLFELVSWHVLLCPKALASFCNLGGYLLLWQGMLHREWADFQSASGFPSSCTFILLFPVCAWTRIFEMYKSILLKALGTASD